MLVVLVRKLLKVQRRSSIGGALLTGASYSIGKKEVAKSEANRDRIRGEAEEALRQREAEVETLKIIDYERKM
jgi:hypothetical protein